MLRLSLCLICLTSCTCMFRGSFLEVEEFSFGPIPHGKTEIIHEIINDPNMK